MKLTIAGMAFLVIAWGAVFSLTVFCFAKVLRPKAKPPGDQKD